MEPSGGVVDGLPATTQPTNTRNTRRRAAMSKRHSTPQTSPITILQWNPNSIDVGCASRAALTQYLDVHTPSVVLIQETLLKPKKGFPLVSTFKHKLYRIFHKPCDSNTGARGILTAVLHTIPAVEDTSTTLSICETAHECIDVTITANSKAIRIVNIYKRHTNNEHFEHKTEAELKLNLEQFLEPEIPTFLAGDFNARHPLWGGIHNLNTNPTGEQIATFLDDHGEDYTILNDDSPTFHRPHLQELQSTSIDLKIVSHHLIHKSGWQLTSLL